MESKIITKTKNPFLNREEITLEITNEVAPSFDEVKSIIGKDTELIVVKKINTNFGRHKFIAEAVVYETSEAKEKIEVIPKKVRKRMEEEKKAAEDAAKKAEEEAKASEAEKPAEEKTEEIKEEAPVEEKKE